MPEIPFEWEKVANAVGQRDADGYKCTLIVVSEGAKPKDGEESHHLSTNGEYRLGGIGEIVTAEVAGRTGKESRCCVLGHLQRGGAPTPLDRLLGTQFGLKAVQLIAEGKFGTMATAMLSIKPNLAMEVSNEPFLKAIAAIGKMYWRRLSLSRKLNLQEDAMDRERSSFPKIPIHPASDVACRLGGMQKENKSLFSLLLEIESRMRAETRNEKINQLFKRSKKRERQYQYSRVDNLSRYCE